MTGATVQGRAIVDARRVAGRIGPDPDLVVESFEGLVEALE